MHNNNYAIGMAVDWPESTSLTDNSWVNIQGTLDTLNLDGQRIPVIRAQTVTPVQEPEQPYLYP